jgi:hypothetical protein
MAVLAGEVVAGETHGRIGRVLADIARRVDDQLPAVADQVVLGAFAQLGKVDCLPIGGGAPEDIAGAKPSRRCDQNRHCDDQSFSHLPPSDPI